MKLALAIVVATIGVADAAPNPWGVEVPAGFEEQAPEIVESALAPLRAATGTPKLVGAIYLSRENQSQLTIVRYDIATEPTRTAIVDYDKRAAESAAKEATKHISDSRAWDGDQLVGESTDEMGPARVQMKKRYALDGSNTMHVLQVTCAAPPERIAACTKSFDSMKLTIDDQRAPRPDMRAGGSDNVARRTGIIIGVLLLGFALIYLVYRIRPRLD